MKELALKLIQMLKSSVTPDGELPRPPKKKGSKGFLIHTPKPYQLDVLVGLSSPLGWTVIPSKTNDVVDGRHVYIGPAEGAPSFDNEEECLDYALDCIND